VEPVHITIEEHPCQQLDPEHERLSISTSKLEAFHPQQQDLHFLKQKQKMDPYKPPSACVRLPDKLLCQDDPLPIAESKRSATQSLKRE
jgi:hypothetical protein